MKEWSNEGKPVLVVGNKKLTFSIVVCLLQAGHPVTLFTEKKNDAFESIHIHLTDLSKQVSQLPKQSDLKILDTLDSKVDYSLVIAATEEDILIKKTLIDHLEKVLPLNSTIAINTESIPLSTLQKNAYHPERIIGVNWSEPAHTTYFLELITNTKSNMEVATNLFNLAKARWNKDPYIIKNDVSVRAKMFAAMVREAFYLVENDYASIEDIDRACRNDAGYYLPFAGNFRYMDLMGTNSYGIVMKDINPELSKDDHLPGFFNEIISQGRSGMEDNNGFYKYEDSDVKRWNKLFRQFSYQIQQLISKYPFNYKEEEPTLTNRIKSDVYE